MAIHCVILPKKAETQKRNENDRSPEGLVLGLGPGFSASCLCAQWPGHCHSAAYDMTRE